MPVLLHSPADILSRLLIDLGLGTNPEDNLGWPVYVNSEPDAPDNVITVYDTAGRDNGRHMTNGETIIHHGFMTRIRATTHVVGWSKANAIHTALGEEVRLDLVTIEGTSYIVYAVSNIGPVLSLYKNTPTDKRNLFTINANITVCAD